jgi:hypothetical protein
MKKTMPGTFVLSLDAELAWGSFDKRLSPELVRAAEWENREGIPRLLGLLCRHRISATWAFVGHATLDHCSGHPEMEPVSYDWYSGDWFQHDPASDELRHPEWYARSCFLKVLHAPYPQEIGFHSFSHVIFGNPGTPRERAIQEFAACRKIAKEFGIRGDAFVFPRNRVGFLDELRGAGFRTFRAPDMAQHRTRYGAWNKVFGVLADFFALTPLLSAPYQDHGLVALPGSLMLRAMDGWRRLIPLWKRANLRTSCCCSGGWECRRWFPRPLHIPELCGNAGWRWIAEPTRSGKKRFWVCWETKKQGGRQGKRVKPLPRSITVKKQS